MTSNVIHLSTADYGITCDGRQHSICRNGHSLRKIAFGWEHCVLRADDCPSKPYWNSAADRAASLVSQYNEQRGPLEGDPFDADLWMSEAAAALAEHTAPALDTLHGS